MCNPLHLVPGGSAMSVCVCVCVPGFFPCQLHNQVAGLISKAADREEALSKTIKCYLLWKADNTSKITAKIKMATKTAQPCPTIKKLQLVFIKGWFHFSGTEYMQSSACPVWLGVGTWCYSLSLKRNSLRESFAYKLHLPELIHKPVHVTWFSDYHMWYPTWISL